MPTPSNPPATREKTLIDVEVLDFGPLYEQAVEHYVSLDPARQAWPQSRRDRLVIRTECRWGRVYLEDQSLYLLNERGEGPRQPLTASTKAQVALFAEMPPQDDDPGFFESTPFCKVALSLEDAAALKSIGIVALEDFIRAKIPELEAAFEEWRSLLREARARIVAARARKVSATPARARA